MDWNAIGAVGTWFAGIATFAAVFYVIWHDYRRRPQLLISFDNSRDVKTQKDTGGVKDLQLGRIPDSRWLRVSVMNANGRGTAKNCRAFLIRITKDGEDIYSDIRDLRWMHDRSDTHSGRDILPGMTHCVDVVGAAPKLEGLTVRTIIPWSLLTDPGDYLFTIQVSAEEADAKVIKVQVHWDGKWESLSGEQVQV
jgi:hypothetical protein